MEKQVAVLIDGDNISAKYAESIKQEALQYGNIKVFRLYGSVNSPNTKNGIRSCQDRVLCRYYRFRMRAEKV